MNTYEIAKRWHDSIEIQAHVPETITRDELREILRAHWSLASSVESRAKAFHEEMVR